MLPQVLSSIPTKVFACHPLKEFHPFEKAAQASTAQRMDDRRKPSGGDDLAETHDSETIWRSPDSSRWRSMCAAWMAGAEEGAPDAAATAFSKAPGDTRVAAPCGSSTTSCVVAAVTVAVVVPPCPSTWTRCLIFNEYGLSCMISFNSCHKWLRLSHTAGIHCRMAPSLQHRA